MKAWRTPIRGPARHVHGVAVPVGPLPGEFSTRVAVHAPRMLKDSRHLSEFLFPHPTLSRLPARVEWGILCSRFLDECDRDSRHGNADDHPNPHTELAGHEYGLASAYRLLPASRPPELGRGKVGRGGMGYIRKFLLQHGSRCGCADRSRTGRCS
jgi:hypothetical protein